MFRVGDCDGLGSGIQRESWQDQVDFERGKLALFYVWFGSVGHVLVDDSDSEQRVCGVYEG